MPGYQLVELASMKPAKQQGISPYENDIGFLDFLRELGQDPFPFPKFHRLMVRGLEVVLFASRPREDELALRIHKLLREASQDLERKLIEVQIVFQGKLVKGDTLWVEYRKAKLPIGHIFGSPLRQKDAHGTPFYKVNFHLTNG